MPTDKYIHIYFSPGTTSKDNCRSFSVTEHLFNDGIKSWKEWHLPCLFLSRKFSSLFFLSGIKKLVNDPFYIGDAETYIITINNLEKFVDIIGIVSGQKWSGYKISEVRHA